jgi:chaperonin cofactor prefoldin
MMSNNLTGYRAPLQRIRNLEDRVYDQGWEILSIHARINRLEERMRRLRERMMELKQKTG